MARPTIRPPSAGRAGADHVVRHTRNRGLAAAFQTALVTALRLGADVIVNTDGDNQYPQAELPSLVNPILRGAADVVVADRQTARIAHFSPLKKALQTVGSTVVRAVSGTGVRDAPSGFRAYSREAALRLYVHSPYSYTLETLIQAGAQRLRVLSVPIVVNPQLRPSRLASSLPSYLLHSATTLVRAYVTYRPLVVFSLIGALFLALGTAGILRFLYYVIVDGGAGHVQSVVLAGSLWSVGVMIVLSGLQADLAAANRRLTEESAVRAAPRDARRWPDPLPAQLPGGHGGWPRAPAPPRAHPRPTNARGRRRITRTPAGPRPRRSARRPGRGGSGNRRRAGGDRAGFGSDAPPRASVVTDPASAREAPLSTPLNPAPARSGPIPPLAASAPAGTVPTPPAAVPAAPAPDSPPTPGPARALPAPPPISVDPAAAYFGRGLLALFVLALALRVWRLDGLGGFDWDEVATVYIASRPLAALLSYLQGAPFEHPPLYYLLAHAWLGLGSDETALRLLSATLGALTVPLLGAVGARLGGPRVGLLAAALLAVAPAHVFYSRDARMYPLLVLLGALALYALIRARQGGARGWWAVWAASALAALATHYYAIFLVGGQMLYLLGARRPDRRAVIATISLVVLAMAALASWWAVAPGPAS